MFLLGGLFRFNFDYDAKSWAILGSSWALLGPSWGHLGVFLGLLGAILGALGLILGVSWGSLGLSEAHLWPSYALLEPVLRYLGATLGILGPSGGVFCHVRLSQAHLDGLLGLRWAIFGLPWAISSAFGSILRAFSYLYFHASAWLSMFFRNALRTCEDLILSRSLFRSRSFYDFVHLGDMFSCFEALHLQRASRSHAKTGLS